MFKNGSILVVNADGSSLIDRFTKEKKVFLVLNSTMKNSPECGEYQSLKTLDLVTMHIMSWGEHMYSNFSLEKYAASQMSHNLLDPNFMKIKNRETIGYYILGEKIACYDGIYDALDFIIKSIEGSREYVDLMKEQSGMSADQVMELYGKLKEFFQQFSAAWAHSDFAPYSSENIEAWAVSKGYISKSNPNDNADIENDNDAEETDEDDHSSENPIIPEEPEYYEDD